MRFLISFIFCYKRKLCIAHLLWSDEWLNSLGFVWGTEYFMEWCDLSIEKYVGLDITEACWFGHN